MRTALPMTICEKLAVIWQLVLIVRSHGSACGSRKFVLIFCYRLLSADGDISYVSGYGLYDSTSIGVLQSFVG